MFEGILKFFQNLFSGIGGFFGRLFDGGGQTHTGPHAGANTAAPQPQPVSHVEVAASVTDPQRKPDILVSQGRVYQEILPQEGPGFVGPPAPQPKSGPAPLSDGMRALLQDAVTNHHRATLNDGAAYAAALAADNQVRERMEGVQKHSRDLENLDKMRKSGKGKDDPEAIRSYARVMGFDADKLTEEGLSNPSAKEQYAAAAAAAEKRYGEWHGKAAPIIGDIESAKELAHARTAINPKYPSIGSDENPIFKFSEQHGLLVNLPAGARAVAEPTLSENGKAQVRVRVESGNMSQAGYANWQPDFRTDSVTLDMSPAQFNSLLENSHVTWKTAGVGSNEIAIRTNPSPGIMLAIDDSNGKNPVKTVGAGAAFLASATDQGAHVAKMSEAAERESAIGRARKETEYAARMVNAEAAAWRHFGIDPEDEHHRAGSLAEKRRSEHAAHQENRTAVQTAAPTVRLPMGIVTGDVTKNPQVIGARNFDELRGQR